MKDLEIDLRNGELLTVFYDSFYCSEPWARGFEIQVKKALRYNMALDKMVDTELNEEELEEVEDRIVSHESRVRDYG